VNMTRAGFLGPVDVVTAEDGGLLGTYSDGGHPEVLTSGLGQHWELMGITTRLWPAAAALQGVMTIIASEDVPEAGSISQVTVGLPPANFQMNADMPWQTPFQAQLSARYITSVALHDRAVWLDQFAPPRLADREVSGFASDHVSVHEDASLPEGGVALEVRMTSGEIRKWRRDRPKGHPEDPATWDEVAQKMTSASAGVIDESAVEEILAIVEDLERHDNLSVLGRLLSRGT